jgi:hypothetical protein
MLEKRVGLYWRLENAYKEEDYQNIYLIILMIFVNIPVPEIVFKLLNFEFVIS